MCAYLCGRVPMSYFFRVYHVSVSVCRICVVFVFMLHSLVLCNLVGGQFPLISSIKGKQHCIISEEFVGQDCYFLLLNNNMQHEFCNK